LIFFKQRCPEGIDGMDSPRFWELNYLKGQGGKGTINEAASPIGTPAVDTHGKSAQNRNAASVILCKRS
jgi:hypothetical protein